MFILTNVYNKSPKKPNSRTTTQCAQKHLNLDASGVKTILSRKFHS